MVYPLCMNSISGGARHKVNKYSSEDTMNIVRTSMFYSADRGQYDPVILGD